MQGVSEPFPGNVKQMRAAKIGIKLEDWRGLTPLFYQHVNPYGRFTLDMTQCIPLSLTKIA